MFLTCVLWVICSLLFRDSLQRLEIVGKETGSTAQFCVLRPVAPRSRDIQDLVSAFNCGRAGSGPWGIVVATAELPGFRGVGTL